MRVLGIEGTSHTFGAGIVDDSGVLSDFRHTYIPDEGGIHPREAAIHHFERAQSIISTTLEIADLSMRDIDLVAFSQGPGLGPCLRIAATSARTLALQHKLPIIGVNHPLGHIEIGRKLCNANDPVVLYVSGGNTQIIAHGNGRYRVFGETLDIGLGNMLDKLARRIGIPFPGGPRIEEKARFGKKLLSLPYSVRGMDTAFSGILTAAMSHLERGEAEEDICFSVQEHSFAMLVEVLERALVHLGKKEVLLTGGVAMNGRLRNMVEEMAVENDVRVVNTPPEFCMDNGAMIAEAGLKMYSSGLRQNLADTSIMQDFRIDQVNSPWVHSSTVTGRSLIGSESTLRTGTYHGRSCVTKTRPVKGYRHKDLDNRLRYERMRDEVVMLNALRVAGIPVPMVYDADISKACMTLEKITGNTFRDSLVENGLISDEIKSLGAWVAKMHRNGLSHGDLTTSNIIVSGQLVVIDPSMGAMDSSTLELGSDLVTLQESFNSAHGDIPQLWDQFMNAYLEEWPGGNVVIDAAAEIKKRRRYQ